MNIKEFIEKFETLTIKDFSANYDSIKKSLKEAGEKASFIKKEFLNSGDTIATDKLPGFIAEINNLLKMFE